MLATVRKCSATPQRPEAQRGQEKDAAQENKLGWDAYLSSLRVQPSTRIRDVFPATVGALHEPTPCVDHSLGSAICWLPESPSSTFSSAAFSVRKGVKNCYTARNSAIGTSREEPW